MFSLNSMILNLNHSFNCTIMLSWADISRCYMRNPERFSELYETFTGNPYITSVFETEEEYMWKTFDVEPWDIKELTQIVDTMRKEHEVLLGYELM